MSDKKICPILPPDPHHKLQECVADKCAWWDGMENKCAVAVISFFLRMGIRVKK